MPQNSYNVRRGAAIPAAAIMPASSHNTRMSEGYMKFYTKGTATLAIVQKSGINIMVTPIDTESPVTQTAIYDKVVNHKDFYDFMDSLPPERENTTIIWDSDVGIEVDIDSFIEYLPYSFKDQLFVMVTETKDGGELISWPPYRLKPTEGEDGDALLLAALYASRRLLSPTGGVWSMSGKILVLLFIADYLNKDIPHTVDALERLVDRQGFFIPEVDPLPQAIPDASKERLFALTKKLYDKHPYNVAEKEREEKPQTTNTNTQLVLMANDLKDGKISLGYMLAMGVDAILKTLQETIVYEIEMDYVLDKKFGIRKMIVWGNAILVESSEGNDVLEDIAVALDTENVFMVEDASKFFEEMEKPNGK